MGNAGNKSPPPQNRGPHSGSMSSHHPPGGEGTILRCPACTRVVRAPPGAQRFRCPCGRILAQPPPASSTPPASGTGLQSQTRSIPPQNPGANTFTPLPSATRNIPPQQTQRPVNQRTPTANASARVSCPTCRQILIPPPGAPQFRCPCGQMLRPPNPPAPQQQHQQQASTPANPSLRVRCPRCATILEAPPGAPVFQCRCGIHLAPPTQAPSSRALPVTSSDSNSDLSGLQAISIALTGQNVGNWRRRIVHKTEGARLGWRKIFNESDEAFIMEAEQRVLAGITEDNLNHLSVTELRNKLTKLGLDAHSNDKTELVGKALVALEDLAHKVPEAELRKRLEERGVDATVCQDAHDLATRLFCYEWSDGSTVQFAQKDGHVRVLTSQSSLSWGSAADFLLPVGTLVPAQTILDMSSSSFPDKAAWFRKEMDKIRIPWETGHVKVVVKRSTLFDDSFRHIYNLPATDMHKYWRYEFFGEPGVDAGGIAREWFSLVSDASFNVDLGLFEYGGTDNVCYQLSPNSGLANEDHLQYFKFFGRVLGRALFEGQQIGAHLTRVMYKHLLAWPIVEADLEFVDQQVWSSLKQLREMDDISVCCLDFTATMNVFGDNQVVELKPGGKDIEVTNENLEEFVELRIKQLCMDQIKPQLHALLIGFYEVVPIHLLSVFTFNELELLLCGLPKISVDDWIANTVYRGAYETLGRNHPVIKMFWEVIRESSDEQRAKFLQFATGTSRVPVQGFAALQGNDGNIKPFTIDSLELKNSVYPKAHTCFNRIDLPIYTTKEEMTFRMAQAMQLEGVGFQIE